MRILREILIKYRFSFYMYIIKLYAILLSLFCLFSPLLRLLLRTLEVPLQVTQRHNQHMKNHFLEARMLHKLTEVLIHLFIYLLRPVESLKGRL